MHFTECKLHIFGASCVGISEKYTSTICSKNVTQELLRFVRMLRERGFPGQATSHKHVVVEFHISYERIDQLTTYALSVR